MRMDLEIKESYESLMEEKAIAEIGYMQVARKYHIIWMPFIDSVEVQKLNLIQSIIPKEEVQHSNVGNFKTSSKEYLNALYGFISLYKPKFENLLTKLKEDTGAITIIAPIKQKKRVWEKAFFDYNNDQSKVVDIGRGSAIGSGIKEVIVIAEWILKHCVVIRMKNRFCDGRKAIINRGGYRDILFNISLNGFIFEIQVHLQALYNLKEESHEILNVARAAIEPTLYKLSLLAKQKPKIEETKVTRKAFQDRRPFYHLPKHLYPPLYDAYRSQKYKAEAKFGYDQWINSIEKENLSDAYLKFSTHNDFVNSKAFHACLKSCTPRYSSSD